MIRTIAGSWSPETSFSPEALNRWTHGLGCAASVPAAALLLLTAYNRGDALTIGAFGVYCLALVALYAMSALSHGFEERPHVRQAFRVADQVCIYLLIAGTFTPFAATYLQSTFGVAQLVAMWLLAAVGIVLRVRRKGALIGPLDLTLCLVTGWIAVFAVGKMLSVGGPEGFGLVLAGAFCYTGGTWFLMNDHRNPYLHGVWHVATVAGSGCHYLFLLNYVAIPV